MKSIAVGLLALLLAHAAASETIQRAVDAAPDGEVEIVNVSGEVHVIGWDRPQVQLEAEVNSDEEVDLDKGGKRTSIRVRSRHGGEGGESALRVHVPRDSTVSISTVSAPQTIEGVRGEQRLQSVSGGIRTEIAREDFQAKSVSGGITVVGSGETSAHITSVSGHIELRDVGGVLDMTTTNGGIHVSGGTIDRARLKTTNGHVRFESTLKPDARLEAEAINGGLDITLRGTIDAEFDIETVNGAIRNCFGPKPRRKSEYGPGSALRFTEGKGSARVRLKTMNGAIELCR